MRKVNAFNDNYIFEREGKKQRVTLPHTWNTEDYYRGTCTYEKTFAMPEKTEHERVYLEFCGANSSAVVFVNGVEVTRHDGGYATFRVDITEQLREENVLTVEVDNAPNERVYPQKADFTFYGGLYRDVNMLIVSEEHFDLDYYGGDGFYLTPEVVGTRAVVHCKAYYCGEADSILVEISGEAKAELVCDKSTHTAQGDIVIENVRLWNGIKDPYLYHATATLYKNGEEKDSVSSAFGCRTFSFDAEKGFLLNGESYPLRGVSRHQDREGYGNALTREMHAEDVELICSMGANAVRLAHYQHDRYFYELCDEKGLIVWAEIPYITVHMPQGRENTVSQMKELIVQNYNHASIICWAISNEITLQGVTDDLMENHRILSDLIHEMDKSRVSAMANLFMLETDSPLIDVPDIRGYNLYYGWYVGEMEDNDAFFDAFHKEHPQTPIGLTEYGADAVIRLQSPKPEKGDYTESYQALYHEHMLEMIGKRPYLWGTFVWNMFEFGAADRDEAGDPGKNHKGLITFDRKEKKDAFYIYKAWWSDEPFVHLCGSRYHDRVEPVTEIKVYSNQDEIALYVDGVPVETKKGKHVFTFSIEITGTHNIRAVAQKSSVYDEMEIAKTDAPNPSYFADATKVRNWFDEPENEAEEREGFLSLNSTMAEVQATEEGAALLEQMMKQMQGSVAGGMGKDAKIPKSMMAMIARMPLKRLLAQAGMDLESEQAKALGSALSRIPKK